MIHEDWCENGPESPPPPSLLSEVSEPSFETSFTT